MKRVYLIGLLSLLVSVCLVGNVFAEQRIQFSDQPSGLTLLEQNDQGLTVKVEIGALDLLSVSTKEGDFILPVIGGLTRSHKIGEPNLPLANRLISIPFGCKLTTEVIDYKIEEISLTALGLTDPIMPVQPSLCKSVDPESVPFEYNHQVYMESGYYQLPLSDASIIGTMRSQRVGMISVAPVEYNPTENIIRVYKEITVRVEYVNPDWAQTEIMYSECYSPFFEPINQRLLNYDSQSLGTRDDLMRYPIKMMIISDRMFEAQLQPFIEWKIKKGFIIVTGYTDVIGSSTTAIKSFIENEYNASGTPENPKPSFVLLVGDTPQIPAFSASGHITDLRYCEFTGDDLPEIYYGRFSAQNTGDLQPQIDKTLEYEQYTMPDPSYLGEVTMIAGVDSWYASTYGNGQINYGTINYFNAAHGIYSNTWLYPDSDDPSASDAIIQTVNEGIGYINYTAHCGHEGFGNPSFTVTDIGNLTNEHKYLMGVGNCCSSNTFGETSPCFGEAWLQAANKGGIGYLGGSDGTYWDEDYWWGVGYGPVIGAGPTYEETGIGAYDGTFHDHGEPVSQHYVTNYAMNMAGNLAVTESGSSRIQYYWEIYHLMGDPSVSTYMGVPSTNTIVYDNTVLLTATEFTVQADPGSYVGISVVGVLHGAGYVDASGTVVVPLAPFAVPGTADIVITAQNRVPHISTIQIISPDGAYVIHDSYTIDDATGNNDGLVDCGESIILGEQVINVGPEDALNVQATITSGDSYVLITDATESFGTVLGNDGTAYSANAFAFDVFTNCPDGHTVIFDLEVTGDERATWMSNISVPVHAPVVDYVSVIVNDYIGNGNGILDPDETAELTVTLRNDGSGTATATTGILSSTDIYINVPDPNGAFGDIVAGGGEANNSTDVFEVSALAGCDMGHLTNFTLEVTSGSGYSTLLNFSLIVGDRVVIYSDDFSINQGWIGLGSSAEWEIGSPSGGNSGSNADPTEDYSPTTDNQVLGNDLGTAGNYSNNIDVTYWVTSPIIDCSNYTSMQMTYYRWLGVESSSWDHAYFEVYDGSSWVTLFHNPASSIGESSWNLREYDLSEYADSNSNFQIRFGLGRTDGSITYCGWNIDDIEIKGYSQGSPGNPELEMIPTDLVDSLVQGELCMDTIVVRNVGDAVLQISFTSTDSWLDFNELQIPVPPDDSILFEVTVLSELLSVGDNAGSLHYITNDIDNPSGDVPVSVYIYVPQINVSTDPINDTLEAGEQVSVPLVINNDGPGRLDYSIVCETFAKFLAGKSRMRNSTVASSADNWLSTLPADGSIDPFSFDSIDVILDATELTEGVYNGQLNISSNDPLTSIVQIPVVLTVTPTYLPGDADGNDIVEVSDVVFLIDFIFNEGPAPVPLEAGDVDCNGVVEVSDASYLVDYIFNGGPAPCEGK